METYSTKTLLKCFYN